MTAKFLKAFSHSFSAGTNSSDSEGLTVWNTSGAMSWVTALGRKILVFVCWLAIEICDHSSIFNWCGGVQKCDFWCWNFMCKFNWGMGVISMDNKVVQLLLGKYPLHVYIVYETKPRKRIMKCGSKNMFLQFAHKNVGIGRSHLCSHSCTIDL